jgi:hypothetical protein
MTDQLFEGYGTPKPPRKRSVVTIPTEPIQPGWFTVRHTQGVYPYSHRVKTELPLSGMVTLCGLKGSKLSNIGVDYMVRCPSCDLADQLS